MKKISIIGAGVIDVLAGAVDEKIFSFDSTEMDYVKLSFGGDALNQSIVLSRLGKSVKWISKLGDDDAGQQILNYAKKNGVDISGVKVQSNLATGVTVVLVDTKGERRFLTNPHSSLRKLSEEDIVPHIDDMADIVSFASLFISSMLDVPAMERLFRRIKTSKRTLALDMKYPARGERLEELSGVLSNADYFFPNESELAALANEEDIDKNISALLNCGLKCAVVKRGGKGCIIATKNFRHEIPAYPVEKVIDTTGAGDSFAAGFLWALSEGWQLEDCGKFACAVASCSVEEVGAVAGVTSLEKAMQRYEAVR